MDASLDGDAGHDAGPASVTIGNPSVSVTFQIEPFGLRIVNASGRTVLDSTALPSITADPTLPYVPVGLTHRTQTLRPALIEGWDHVTGTDAAWHSVARVVRWSATDTAASFDLADPTDATVLVHYEVQLVDADVRIDAVASGVAGDAASTPSGLNEMGQAFSLGANDHFYGLGERSVTVDHRGQHYQCWCEEGGIGQGESVPPGPNDPSPNGTGMTYAPVPFVLSTQGFGIWMDTSFRTGFDLGADDPRAFRIYAVEPALHLHVLVHDDPRDTIADYTRLTGRAHLPAPWVFGPRRRVDHGAMVGTEPEELALRSHDVPTTMIDDTMHFLPSQSQIGREAFLLTWTAQMHALGFKAIGYFNPYLSVTNPTTADLVAFGRANHYFVQTAQGMEFDTTVISGGPQSVATFDLTIPGAVAWYQTLLQQAVDLGYDGWMQDFGEYISPTSLLADGRTGWEAHNAFPLLQQQAVWDFFTRTRGNDFQYFVRSAYSGSQAVAPMMWSGDPAASYDPARGLPSMVRNAVNLGMSGIPFWGSDISGYTCLNDPVPNEEVYLRWTEFGALCPDMHDENACAQAPAGSPPKWDIWSNAETTTVYGNYARLHTRLLPYIYAAAAEAADTGMPIMRHPWLLYPTNATAMGVSLEYFFGPALYVAPVVHRGDTSRTLWLPPGTWVDWWTRAISMGDQMVTRDAPIDIVPLYLLSGGIVPMLDSTVVTLAPHTDPSVVGIDDVRDRMDLIAAIDVITGSGREVLADGTVFDIALATGATAIPTGMTMATPDPAGDAMLASCASASARIQGTRVQITVPAVTDAVVQAGALRLHHHSATPLCARWDVTVVGM